ncbi:lysozyme [Agrobacterium rosae]|uniref:lysozyme n=1 Tax=Agrobacterium rosae TaxID=1972867 RepID=UPI00122F03A5|nr:lysozyme [Agrobacterium rosae]KAA3506304.1 lysozyme [Agrobacterium rosae]KAA3510674.1 lysozyme [Agrobacterium rosae]MQB51389.1 lysozyme [Agrobacterium rosae]
MLNKASIDLIKSFEGLKLQAYLCPANVQTIGYRTTKGPTRADVGRKTVTEAEATRLLLEDVARFEKAVDKLVKVKLTENQRGALVSFTYNLGEGNLGSSTLLKKVNAGDFKAAQSEFAKWDEAGGTVLASSSNGELQNFINRLVCPFLASTKTCGRSSSPKR